jgi:hypothetical protein
MFRFILRKVLLRHRDLFFREAQQISGFLHLLMKQRNTDERWTAEEKKEIRRHLKHLAMYIPAIVIFLLPGGSLLLPVFAEIMDRRKARRQGPKPAEAENTAPSETQTRHI